MPPTSPTLARPPQGMMDAPGSTPNRRASLKILSRNINQVVLGNMLFHTWYYSPYPDAVIMSPPQHAAKHASDVRNGVSLANGGVGTPVLKGSGGSGIVCERLYVCPVCFRYTPEEEGYAGHVAIHQAEAAGMDAGGEEGLLPVPETAFKVYEWEGYVVWEVDGETEKLYCQNLSLFAKLFLEQKSVFFDTGGFKYYVLTYTKPEMRGRRGRKRASSGAEEEQLLFKTQVLGFFSKENLSWDSNNLACILVFPPYQHRQLGQLLMAVSYKLSGWEWEGGVIGGPEKPLSAMGRKAYLRFWSERIARFFMGQTADADQHKVFEKISKRKTGFAKEEMTVKDIGDRTGMLTEDVIAALNEMGVCDVKPVKRKKKPSGEGVNGVAVSSTPSAAHTEIDEQDLANMSVSRAKVLQWIELNKVDLIAPVREEGFLGEWALSDLDSEAEDADEDELALEGS